MSFLKGKVIAITGAASGIGLATAKLLASRGAILSASDINLPLLRKSFPSSSPHMTTAVDVSSSSQVNTWIASTVSKLGKLDGAANIAGIGPRTKPIRALTDTDWDLVNNINAKGVFYCLRAQLPHMTSPSSIVNVASVAGLGGGGGSAEYVSSKHAVVGMTKVAAREEGVNGVRVNVVAPGAVYTALITEMEERYGLKKEDFPLKGAVFERFADPVEIANTIAFLLSEETKFVTGSVWTIDGGWCTH